MPVMNVNLVLDDATYAGIQNGVLELCGMVKDQNHRIRKHLPTVVDYAKEGAVKAVDIVRTYKRGMLIIGGVVIIGGAVAGTATYFAQKGRRKAKKQLDISLQVYIDATRTGTLTIEILDALINDLTTVSKQYKEDNIPVNLSANQFFSLFYSIYDYTKRMADANNIDPRGIKAPSRFKKNSIVDLQDYLHIQRTTLSTVA